MLNIILFGPPGAGKGTQSERIIKKYNLVHIATGDLFRKHMSEGTPLGQLAQQYIKEGQLVPDEVTIKMVEEKIESNRQSIGFIFDGFPRTVLQAEQLGLLLKKRKMSITGVVALEVPDETLKERLQERAKTSGRVDDQDDKKIQTRLHVYHQETSPVAHYYDQLGKLRRINGVGTIDHIFDAICKAIQSFQQ